jgi:hypothetical protein
MPKVMSRLSTDDFLIPVTPLIVQGLSSDPTGDLVYFAFVPVDQANPPTLPGDFSEGFWLNTGAQYIAGITIGPEAAVSLGVGKYNGWIWIVDSPTQPVQQVDTLQIT